MLTWLSKHVFFSLWELKDGAHRGQYLRELNESQWLDSQTLHSRQWDRLCQMVTYAFKSCSYYQERFSFVGFDGTLNTWGDFQRLPFLTKQDIRNNGDRLLSREFQRSDLVESKTGGSTGTALRVFADKQCQEMRNAAAMHSDQWSGWDIGMKVAAVWGNPPLANTLRKKLRNLLLDRLMYLDTMDINDSSVRRFVEDWRRYKPQFMFGHSHSLYILATYLQRMGIENLRPRGIVGTSMMLLEPERRLIEQVFRCKVTNRYGCEEVSLIGCECEQHKGLHLNVEHVVVEFLREDGTEALPGEDAEIVVTELINRGMPLIRYRIGDRGVLSDRACDCGRGLPLMKKVTGRTADFLKRPDGSLVAGVSLVERTLTAIPGIEQMQLLQNERHRICVRLVKNNDFDAVCESRLHHELQSVFGDEVAIELEYVQALDQTSSGKYRFAVCNV